MGDSSKLGGDEMPLASSVSRSFAPFDVRLNRRTFHDFQGPWRCVSHPQQPTHLYGHWVAGMIHGHPHTSPLFGFCHGVAFRLFFVPRVTVVSENNCWSSKEDPSGTQSKVGCYVQFINLIWIARTHIFPPKEDWREEKKQARTLCFTKKSKNIKLGGENYLFFTQIQCICFLP